MLAASVYAVRRDPVVVSVAVCVGFCAVGTALGAAARAERETPLVPWFEAALARDGSEFVTEVEGQLQRDGVPTDYGASLTVDVDRVGRTIRVTARLRRPARYANVGLTDEATRLERGGIALLVDVVRPGSIRDEWGSATRAAVRRAVTVTVGAHDARSTGIVTAILIGDRAGLGRDTTERLQQAWTYHVIAISGGNIAVLSGAILIGLRLGGGERPIGGARRHRGAVGLRSGCRA